VKIALRALSAEIVFTGGSDGLFCSLIADAAHKNVLATLAILLQDQIGMVSDLSHLHDETEDVGVVVKQNALGNIGLELSGTAVHDTSSEVVLFFTKELAVNIDLFGRKFHRRRMVTLDTTKHEAVRQDSQLSECLFSRALVAEFLNRIEQLLVENRNMLHAAMVATLAAVVIVHLPIESRAWALLAEVAGKWADVEETDQGKEFANAILQWSSGQAPLVIGLQRETGLGRSGSTLLQCRSLVTSQRLAMKELTLMLCASSRMTRWNRI
jgi:hypothetical protein